MSSVTMATTIGRALSDARSRSATVAIYATTLFVASLLQFSVLPIAAKLALPAFAGAQSVWAVAICVFLAAMPLANRYAEVLTAHLSARFAVLAHLMLCSITLLTLPLALPGFVAASAGSGSYLTVTVALILAAGLPVVATTATIPLLHTWFQRTGTADSQESNLLYGASTGGAVFAALAYPLIIEPAFGLGAQTSAWTMGFITLSILITAAGLLMLASDEDGTTAVATGNAATSSTSLAVDTGDRLYWAGLAALPTALIVSFSGSVAKDIAAPSAIWMVPLAALLLTAHFAPRTRPATGSKRIEMAHTLAVAAALAVVAFGPAAGLVLQSITGLAAVSAIALVCHRALFASRPAGRNQSAFHASVSLGSVAGAVFATVIAPQLFSVGQDWPLLLVLSLICGSGLATAFGDATALKTSGRVLAGAAAAALLLWIAAWIGLFSAPAAETVRSGLMIAAVGLLTTTVGNLGRRTTVAMALAVFLLTASGPFGGGTSARGFAGMRHVAVSADKQFHILGQGAAMQGSQRVRGIDGASKTSLVPTGHLYPNSPIARGIDVARLIAATEMRAPKVAVVGLGTGALSCYARPGESWQFYESNPLVLKLARNTSYFTYLASCARAIPVIESDPRLALALTPARTLDYLIVDGFTAGAAPTHLLTREALAIYLSSTTRDGLVALHLTNSRMDLVSAGIATAASIPDVQMALVSDAVANSGPHVTSSQVLFLSHSKASIEQILALPGARSPAAGNAMAWTDDRSGVIAAILGGARVASADIRGTE